MGEHTATQLNLGDLVEAVPPFALACGSGRYGEAVIVSVNPLIAISDAGDMLWSTTITQENLRSTGRASGGSLKRAFERLARDLERGWQPPVVQPTERTQQ